LKTSLKVMKTGIFELATAPATFRWAKNDSLAGLPANGRGGFRQKAAFFNFLGLAALCRDAAT
jgi:hypothetical protein